MYTVRNMTRLSKWIGRKYCVLLYVFGLRSWKWSLWITILKAKLY